MSVMKENGGITSSGALEHISGKKSEAITSS